MAPSPSMVGMRFGRLTVVSQVKTAGKNSVWLCLCDCGERRSVYRNALVRGMTRSCGCLSRELLAARKTTHGYTSRGIYRTEYGIWAAMLRRCLNPNCLEFKNYGGRGITVCERWHQFENFIADMGPRPPRLTLDRLDNDGNYTPENCAWRTRKDQSVNSRRTSWVVFNGVRMTLEDASTKSGLPYSTLVTRRRAGRTPETMFLPKTGSGGRPRRAG